MFLKLYSLICRSRPADPGWPLDLIDIDACAAVWGLPEPVPYTTNPIPGDDSPPIGRCCYHWEDLGISAPIWLNPEIVRSGHMFSRYDGSRQDALTSYAHEVGHYLTGPGHGHNIVFAAITAFLLARLPGDWSIDGELRGYDVQQVEQHATPFRRGAKADKWRVKAEKYSLRVAVDWGWELARDPDLTAPQAMEIIKQWDQERRTEIDKKEQIEDRLTFALVGLALVGLVGWWIWQMSRPLI